MSIADKLTTIAENEQKVYDAGAKSEYDRFWDAYQENGKRSMYQYGFSGYGWTDETFKPKYDIVMNFGNGYAFYYAKIGDLTSLLERSGVYLDTSRASALEYAFARALFTRLPTIDVRGITSTTALYNVFYDDYSLQEIEKFIIAEHNVFYSKAGMFLNCVNLTHVIFEGVMADTLSLASCSKLDLESLKSIITTLKDFSGTGKEFSKTLTLNSDSIALLEAEGATAEYTDSEGNVTTMTWIELIDAKKWNLVSA